MFTSRPTGSPVGVPIFLCTWIRVNTGEIQFQQFIKPSLGEQCSFQVPISLVGEQFAFSYTQVSR